MLKLNEWSWPAFWSTYGLVFLMELLDNTQLVQVYYSSKYGRQWLLAAASWSAFALTGLIGASFSGIRELSEHATKGIEWFFAMLLFAMGVITLSHSEKVLRAWRALALTVETRFTKPFLYRMGEGEDDDEDLECEEIAEDEVEPEEGLGVSGASSVAEGKVEEKHLVSKKQPTRPRQRKPRDLEEGNDLAKDGSEERKGKQHSITLSRLFVLVFVTVFVLELPDKTMIMIVTLAQTSDYPVSVFVGYALAMITQSIIALAVGKGISRGAERYGELIETAVGVVLLLTGAIKVGLMQFVGDFTIDFDKKTPALAVAA